MRFREATNLKRFYLDFNAEIRKISNLLNTVCKVRGPPSAVRPFAGGIEPDRGSIVSFVVKQVDRTGVLRTLIQDSMLGTC